MLTTIKSKIIVLTFSLLCLLSVLLTATAFYTFHHDKGLIIAGNNASITSFEGKLNKEIAELEKNALDLALMGGIYYQKGKQQEIGEFFTRQILKNYPHSMGNGLYFRPYKISENKKISCIHSVWNEHNQIGMLPSCVDSTFDYFQQNWYPEIIKDLESGRKVSWVRPYRSTQLGILMTTVGAGIYERDNLVGMATVDWELDTILKSVLEIKPTPNSFVLFADKINDYIIATTEPGVDNNDIMGKSLSDLDWYSPDLTEGRPFEYGGVEYIPYVKQLNNGFFLIINIPTAELFQRGIRHLHTVLLLLIVSSLLIVGVLYWVLKRNINQPIAKLTRTAEEIGRGNLNIKIRLDKPTELAQLASVLNKMTTDIKTHIIHLARVSHEKEKLESELTIAHTIQDSSLPKDFPKNECFELQAVMRPAREVGGDFYDFFPIDDRHYAFVMADVSGKGITAALYMMSAKTIIKNMLQAGYSLADAAGKINKGLYDNHARGMFVTAFIGILDKQTGRVDYINAGHCPPLRKTKTGYEYIDVVRNLMLGVMPNYDYKIGSFTLKPDDHLFLYTDGVTEAQTKDEKLYGPDRLKKALEQSQGGITETLKHVQQGIARFTKGADQSDDITMMVLIFYRKKKSH